MVGLRCGNDRAAKQSWKVDIRIKTNDPHSSMCKQKTQCQGVAVFWSRHSLEGTSAVIVLIDAAGNVINKQATIIVARIDMGTDKLDKLAATALRILSPKRSGAKYSVSYRCPLRG